jgi:hypothetical protein
MRPKLDQMRMDLISLMQNAAKDGVDCSNCVGTCCTFISNSMAITDAETQDIVRFLFAQGKTKSEVLALVNQTIDRFGLESTASKQGLIRKTYTCPFFAGRALGCTIDSNSKPIGCLRFNPRVGGQKEGGNCALSVFEHEAMAEFLLAARKPIPIAVRDFLESI